MTAKEAKEKAEEIFNKFYDITPLEASFSDTIESANEKIMNDRKIAKECALIHVSGIIENLEKIKNDMTYEIYKSIAQVEINELEEVKTEINNLS